MITIMMRVARVGGGMCLWGRVEDLLLSYATVQYSTGRVTVFIFIV
jgi:hypothetical protein